MPHFVLTCLDKPAALEVRLANRDKHFAYLAEHPGFVRVAGPFLGDDGKMTGSLMIVEAQDVDAVRAFAAADPYALAGLFERVEIRAWRPTIGAVP